ncbi:vanadium-dependent haloperoxidase [Sabulilitoribacter multivorans]|uniref:Vanadium-dependent haloperoxidase n=1 Tax=Flaviramulus multivorans TaxID=1304750 RepID=A0ABS9IJ46_9FLAO|nr:vanadium-dependent haloperoxidase [Flaviramulus multivorans]MCF7560467.1 vanadium-dependent haloperoxidase [Flaviramulus multivorans]
MKHLKFGIYSFLIMAILASCSKPAESIQVSPELFHKSVDKVMEIQIHDIFSPPVASRIFVYPNIAAYEILAQKSSKFKSLVGTVNELTAIPKVDSTQQVNLELSALIAHMEVSKSLIFSEEKMEVLQDSLYNVWEQANKVEFDASKAYAFDVVNHIKQYMSTDNYNQTRTMAKFTVDTDDPTRWQPTPPSYMDGIEPHWNKIRPFLLDSAQQFKPEPHPEFSLDKDSKFYEELMEVYNVSQNVTEEGDESEPVQIARFWDCNPFVSVTRGHFMFATKKISPGAHWIGITKIASRKTNSNVEETVNAYTKTSLAIADAFISCWDEKYRSNLIRPETVINQHIDPDWLPILQTPPFPEYSSGHSVVSGAASVVLTEIFGDNFYFEDDTEIPFGLPIRSFKSFYDASTEAALSRLYGGIHYRAAIDNGLKQGKNLGHFAADKLNL